MSNKINTNTKIKQIFSKYVDIDDQIKNKNKEINVLKKQRKTLELFIIDLLKSKNIHNVIKINENNKIKLLTSIKKETFSQNFINNGIKEFYNKNYGNIYDEKILEKKGKDLYNFLLSLRKDKEIFSLKRIIIK
jgi:hypothetical protein